MKQTFMGCIGFMVAVFAAMTAAPVANAGTYQDCSPCNMAICGPCDPVCGAKSLWECGGWAETGIYVNEYGQRNAYDNAFFAPPQNAFNPESGNTEFLRNARQSDLQLNQLWLYFGKRLDTRYGWDFGGRIDVAFGTDARYLQSDGLEYRTGTNNYWQTGDYYTSIAQIYGEAGYKNVSVKFGKFLSPLMGDSIMAPDRFFYSMPLAFSTTAVTNTGVLATWKVNNAFSVFGGWVNGADKTFYNSDDNAALFGFDYQWTRNFKIGYAGMIGKNKNLPGVGANDTDYYMHAFNFNWRMSQRWNYKFQWLLTNENTGIPGMGTARNGSYGINNELVYCINRYWALGLRAEWLHGYDAGPNSYDAYEFTVGANWTPCNWLLIRPELRYDHVSGAEPFSVTKGQGLTNKDHQFSAGVSAVVQF